MKLDNNYDSKIGNLFPKNIPNDYFFISDWDLHNGIRQWFSPPG